MSSSALRKGVSHPVAISVPAGSILRVPNLIANSVGLLEVEWDGETIQMFAVDLHDRASLVQAASATSGAK